MPSEPFILPAAPPKREFRANPGPLGGMQTWRSDTWWRLGSCAEVECSHWVAGWVTIVDESTDLGRRQADYIRWHAGRKFREKRTENQWTAFEFYPGQTCFAQKSPEHRVRADIPQRFARIQGDWRRYGGAYIYERVDQFADDLHTDHDRIMTARSRAGTAGP